MKPWLVILLFGILIAKNGLCTEISVPISVINKLINNVERLEWELQTTKTKQITTDKELALMRRTLNMRGKDQQSTFSTVEARTVKPGRTIAFQVKHKSRSVTLGRNEVLKFDTITLNTGNAYNPRSGIFIVPISGTYFFWGNIMSNDKGRFVISLQREGSELSRGYTTYMHSLGVASMTYMAKLRKGEHIWFQNQPHSSSTSNIYGSGYSNYGGALMFL